MKVAVVVYQLGKLIRFDYCAICIKWYTFDTEIIEAHIFVRRGPLE